MSRDNEAVEKAALVADAEGDRLDALVAEMRQQIATSPRRGLKWRLDEFLAGARSARRIAIEIRKLRVAKEEKMSCNMYRNGWPALGRRFLCFTSWCRSGRRCSLCRHLD